MSLKFLRNIVVSSFFALTGLTMTPLLHAADLSVPQVAINQKSNSVTQHTVAKGETVYSIAKAYNVSEQSIYQANPSAASGIRVGQSLNIIIQPTQTVYNYTAKPKDTLYSISKEFGVSVDDIINQNPELRTKSLTEGQTIRIATPARQNSNSNSSTTNQKKGSGFIEHKVALGETVYGISKKYGTTPETLIAFNPELKDTLKEGSIILVPINKDSLVAQNSLLDINAIKIGIVLPFVNQSQGQGARFLEYYEGLLLALEDLKSKGFSANVFTFDIGSETGTTKLSSLLETNELKNLDLLIGGVSTEQVSTLSNFSLRNKIKYVIPFPTASNVIDSNPYVFQVNESQNSLITSVSKAFANRFSNSNVIFVTSSSDKAGFVKDITDQIQNLGMTTKSVVADGSLNSSITSALDLNRRNIIVAASGSTQVLQLILPALSSIKTQQPLANITLFGQPEWQTYTKYIPEYSKYDTYIYSSFFLNESEPNTNQFIENYKNWYNNKSMINTYPRYAVLGYDTGLFFFNALMKYGKSFENSLSLNTNLTLQTPFSFKKVSSDGGYLNTGFYFIHYGSEGYIQKIAYAQW